jgi:hypothetical protein
MLEDPSRVRHGLPRRDLALRHAAGSAPASAASTAYPGKPATAGANSELDKIWGQDHRNPDMLFCLPVGCFNHRPLFTLALLQLSSRGIT